MNSYVRKVDVNVDGRDFVVGDLHGCYDELMLLLGAVSFNTKTDRLFSTGDLVDRGPKPIDCVNLLNYDWFYCIKGNHEDSLIKKFNMINYGDKEVIKDLANSEKEYVMQFDKDMINKMDNLPYLIEVNHVLFDKYYVVHAEILPEHYNEKSLLLETKEYISELNDMFSVDYTEKLPFLVNELSNNNFVSMHNTLEKLIWSRKLIKLFYKKHKNNIESKNFNFLLNPVETKYKVFCGHNIVPMPLKIANQYYLDTGAALGYSDKGHLSNITFLNFGHENYGLTLLDVGSGEVYNCITTLKDNKRGKVIKLKNNLY